MEALRSWQKAEQTGKHPPQDYGSRNTRLSPVRVPLLRRHENFVKMSASMMRAQFPKQMPNKPTERMAAVDARAIDCIDFYLSWIFLRYWTSAAMWARARVSIPESDSFASTRTR